MAIEDILRGILSEKTTDFGKPLMVLPIPGLAGRVLLQNNGLILGKILHIFGEHASFKTTTAMLLGKLFKYTVILHTENKFNDTIKDLIYPDSGQCQVLYCDSLEEWMTYLTKITSRVKEDPDTGPICVIIDSVLGCSSSSAEDIEKSGYVSAKYPVEARMIADYLRSYSRLLNEAPTLTVILVNHRKYKMNPIGGYGVPVKTTLGGGEIRFYAAVEWDLGVGQSQIRLGSKAQHTLFVSTEKNSFGTEITSRLPLCIDENEIYLDWAKATMEFLTKFNIKPEPSTEVVKKIQEICKIEERRAGPHGTLYYCKQLDITPDKAVTARELNMILESREDIVKELHRLLRIQERYVYDMNKSYQENLKAAEEFYSK